MSPLRTHDRLDELALEIRQLRVSLIERDREALELAGDDAEQQRRVERAATIRALLGAAFVEYFELSEEVRISTCPVHGARAPFVGCPTCARAARSRRPTLADDATRAATP